MAVFEMRCFFVTIDLRSKNILSREEIIEFHNVLVRHYKADTAQIIYDLKNLILDIVKMYQKTRGALVSFSEITEQDYDKLIILDENIPAYTIKIPGVEIGK
jgi:hypothetical protein